MMLLVGVMVGVLVGVMVLSGMWALGMWCGLAM
jgi:hypothetical protein